MKDSLGLGWSNHDHHTFRDLGLLEVALFRPQTGYYTDLIEEAAALWESLAQNQCQITSGTSWRLGEKQTLRGRASHRGHRGHRGRWGLVPKSHREHRGVRARNRRYGGEHRTEVTEGD